MTNEEAAKMLRTMQRTVYLGNRKFEDAIECAIKALSEPLQPWEVLAAQAVLSQPEEPKRGKWERHYCEDGNPDGWQCDKCNEWYYFGQTLPNFCPNCGSYNGGEQDE